MTAAPGSPPEPLPGARLLFSLDPAVAYLNHGTVGVTPVPVQRAHQRLRDEVEANPQRFFTRGLHDRVAHARRHLAAFVGADPDGSAFVPNTTFGIATVLRTLGLGTGDEVVTTDNGYGSVDYAVDATGAHRRVVPLALTTGDDEIVAGIRAAVEPSRTRLVIVDLITSSTAPPLPAARIAPAPRGTRGPPLVHGAPAPRSLAPDVDPLRA